MCSQEGRSAQRRRWPRRALWIGLTALLALALLGAGAFWFAVGRYANNVERIPDVFSDLDQNARPTPSMAKATTYLLIGIDTRADGPTTGTDASAAADGSRSDAIMLVQIAEGGSHASIVSIPRDSWVSVPGHGTDKINAAYAFGGPTLLIQTVEVLTDVRVDHFGVIDFAGFKAITDALGGVTVEVSAQTESHGVVFHPGPNRLDGDSALIYVRQRYDLPGSDLDRVQRQQNFLRAVLAEAGDRNLLSSPLSSDRLIQSLIGAISIDDSLGNLGLLSQARQLSRLAPNDVDFLTAPVVGTGWEGGQNVVHLDRPTLEKMMSQLRDGTLPEHAAEYTVLPEIPN